MESGEKFEIRAGLSQSWNETETAAQRRTLCAHGIDCRGNRLGCELIRNGVEKRVNYDDGLDNKKKVTDMDREEDCTMLWMYVLDGWVQGDNKIECGCSMYGGQHGTHPCLSKLLTPFFDCRLSNDLVAYRLDWSVGEDCWLVGDVTKSPVEFQRLPSPVGLLVPLWARRFDADVWDCKAFWLLSCNGAVAFTVAGRGSGDGAGDVLLCESAEWSDPFDWWCWSDRRFKLVLEFAWNLEGELVVLLVLLPLLLKRQSPPSMVVVICVDRTEIEVYQFVSIITSRTRRKKFVWWEDCRLQQRIRRWKRSAKWAQRTSSG